jgi:hypothetical protein
VPSDRHHLLRIALLLVLQAAATHAAEAPPQAEAAPAITALRGQWNFLNSSIELCTLRVPALKAELQEARAHAQSEMRKAEAAILQEVADNPGRLQRYLDLYVANWSTYGTQQAESMKRQDAGKACPVLLANWQAADAELMLEDWGLFLERNIPQPGAN